MHRSYIYKPDYIDNTIDLNSNAAKELDWMSFWEQLFVKSVNSSLDSFAHLNEELKKEQNSEKKTLPMNLEEDALTASEEKSIIQSGYLTRDGEKLYFLAYSILSPYCAYIALLIYSVSSLTTSSKSVMSLRPLTCHIPVIPGLIAIRAL